MVNCESTEHSDLVTMLLKEISKTEQEYRRARSRRRWERWKANQAAKLKDAKPDSKPVHRTE
jgi:hypothetical protein